MAGKYPIPIKILMLGDPEVGKTTLRRVFIQNRFRENYKPTFGFDFQTKLVSSGRKLVEQQIWDVAGNIDLQFNDFIYYRRTQCCMLVFDLTSHTSFHSLEAWRQKFLFHASIRNPETFPFVIIGNKSDRKEKVITRQAVYHWSEHRFKDCVYFETCAMDTETVDAAFKTVNTLVLGSEYNAYELEEGLESYLDLFSPYGV